MKPLVAQAAWLPMLALGAGACGPNITPSRDDHFTFTPLADFEETMGLTPNPMWSGLFLNGVDHSIVPKGYAMTFEQAPIEPARTNPDGTVSTHAMHAAELGLYTQWGTVVFANLKNLRGVDLSSFTGFSIWARSAGMPGMPVKIGFPDLGSFDQVMDGPQLCEPVDMGNGKSCYDDYAAKIYPDGAWRRYDISFASLATGGWGFPHPFDQRRVYRIKITMAPGTKYDLWFDDAAFYVQGF